MNRSFTRFTCFLVLLTMTISMAFAQSITISGTVTDKQTNETLPGVSINVKGKSIGTSTNSDGKFVFSTTESTPFTIVISYLGYKSIEQEVRASVSDLVFALESQSILGQEVVVAASRTPERILESPVSIERFGQAAIRETASPTFYDALNNLKGVEMSAQSLTFKSINTRGFNANGNTRFNQYIDGMDNQAPGLNFSVGNIIGISELDVDNVELLPGASSALYGAGGINGTMLMTSKDPFTSEGVSFSFKKGLNHINDPLRETQPFEEAGIRVAKAWNKFAFKTTFSFLQADDWQAANYSNFDRTARTFKSGNRSSDPNYDGINSYGDEVSQNMRIIANSVQTATNAGVAAATGGAIPNIIGMINASLPPTATPAQIGGFLSAFPAALRPTIQNVLPFNFGLRAGIIPDQAVSRTGYNEANLVDYNTNSLKTSTSLHYKLSNTVQAILQANWGSGTSVYTGSDRYSLRNFSIGQYKLELKGQDFLLRGYTTQERSGDSYISSILGSYINETSKASTTWFPQYIGNYVGARSAGLPDAQAHAMACSVADQGRFEPGSAEFAAAKHKIMNTTISSGLGAKFDDKSNLWHYEGMYNFTNALKGAVELQVGASFRRYDLNSAGTVFDDLNRTIDIDETGAFIQMGKKLGESFKLAVSGRYDKNMNFEGRFTPRITGVYTVAPNNNIRLSYQTGYRNPTTQNQYIDLSVGGGSTRLIGGLPEMVQKYNLYTNKPFTDVSYRNFLASASAGAANPSLLQTYSFDANGVRPESVKAYELGYKGLLGSNVLIDAYGYYNTYKDFITAIEVFQQNGTAFTKFGVPVNAAGDVSAYGMALGMDYLIGKFNLNGNISYNQIGDLPTTYVNDFNTPKVRYNLGISNRSIAKNVGMNVSYRWQDSFYWASAFASGAVPSFGTVDAQVNLKIPSVKGMVKIGASDIFNRYYITSYGNPEMGGMYYVGFTFNQ
ncbi:MAG: TonB-dependent receptor [Daejeonella sp.]|uniref:TonB-dependent receptor n=1 Tax=Daejeonella sp. TaxID=2805397 RepID=UPI0027349698|nr:TonB-dependent receptor [Daejeonella sp.]MDP3468883.1 TonB-dependent receptor [Daejeonella sp.]